MNLAYQGRNLTAFYAQSLRSIYKAWNVEDIEFNSDNRINNMPHLMDLETIMKNKLPFEEFKRFILKYYKNEEVFLNVYCLISILNNKIKGLSLLQKISKKQQ